MNDNTGKPNGSGKDNTPVGGGDNNIFRFRTKEEQIAKDSRLTADEVLTAIVNEENAQDVLVISWDEDGAINMFSSSIPTEQAVHGLECAKQIIMMKDMGL